MKTAKKEETTAQTWRDRYDLAAANQLPKFKKFSSWYDIMYTVYDTSKMAAWRSKVVFPTMGAKTWNLIAKFIGLKPGFEVNVRGEEDEAVAQEKADKASRKLEYDYDNPCFDEPMRDKLQSPLIDAVVTGVGLGKVPWTVKKNARYERMVDEQGMSDLTQELVYESTQGYNDLIPVNVFNIFIDPGAVTLQSALWVIIKEYKTISSLYGTNEQMGFEFYKNLDKLKDAAATSDPHAVYKASRNRIVADSDPISVDTTVQQIAIFECYEKGMISTYAEFGDAKGDKSWLLLRKGKNPYWHGHYPLVPFYIKKRPHDFWGLGIFETNWRVDAAKRDTFNHYMDQLNLTDGGLIAEEGSLVNDFVVEPGFVTEYKGAKPEQFKLPEPNPQQLQLVMTQLDKEMEGDTISPYATGSPNDSTDNTAGTKGGIMAIQEAAGDIVGYMRANFKQSVRLIGQMWLSNNQQFMAAPMTMQINTKEGKQAVQISPADLQGEMELRIDDASMEPTSKEELRAAFQEFTAQLLGLQKASIEQAQLAGTDPLVFDFAAIADEMAEKYGQKEFEKFMVSKDELQQLQMQQQQQLAQQQVEQQQMQAQQQQEQVAAQQQQQMMKQQQEQQKTTQAADSEVQNMMADLEAKRAVGAL